MPRTKIAELGKLTFLDDGGLVCSVTLDEPPSLDASPRAASFYWGWPNPSELAVGDLVAHSEHGVARYRGRERVNSGEGKRDFLVLEFAHSERLYVGDDRSHLIQKLRSADRQLSSLRAKAGKWSQPYCVEVLPNAYEWPGIEAFPRLPRESTPEVMAEWRRACAIYEKNLHANESYRLAAKDYFDLQSREPQPLLNWWVYRAMALRVGQNVSANAHDRDDHLLLIKQYVLRHERNVEKMRREVEALENCGSLEGAVREPIPEHVRVFVWRRDEGQCVRCGSRERLEFDHIIPVIAGGSSTERNIQLLCESCNRSKSATV
jgi:5-methylcytosine-specific restriction endonuclease McrA